MILDTTVLHDLMYGKEDAIASVSALEADDIPIKLSSMTVFELYYGVGYTDKSDIERQKVEHVLRSIPIVPPDERIMRRAGTLDGKLECDGLKTGQSDLIIGTTGVVLDEPVLTRNVSDFERIPELRVETY